MQNGHVESFNGRFRDECLNATCFHTLADAKQKIARWRTEYNSDGPTVAWVTERLTSLPNSSKPHL